MKKLMIIAAVAAMTMATSFAPKPALADGGRIAAGVIGGLAVGAIVGSQMNRNDDGYRHRTSLSPRLPHRASRLGRPLRPSACAPRSRLRLSQRT